MDLRIRSETQADIAAIETVIVAAFSSAEHTDGTEHLIVRMLRDEGELSISLVAEYADTIVGHVAVSPVTVSDGSADWYGLGPVSVVPDRQGRGIGAMLMRRALADLRDSGAEGCVVLGEPSYYGRFGFVVEPSLILPGVPAGYFQAIAFGDRFASGEVAYHRAFTSSGRSNDVKGA